MAKRENVHLRKDGRYEARYIKGRDDEGKLIYGFCYARSYEEAKKKAEEAHMAQGRTDPDIESTFGDFCDSWLAANRAGLKLSSHAKYRTDLCNHLKPYFGARLPREITPEMLDGFTQMLLHDKKLSPKTVRDLLVLFHSVFSYIERRTGQQLRKPEIIYPKDPRKAVRVLDRTEEAVLLKCLAHEMDLYKFGVYLALRTGMRLGEICALRGCDISVQSSTISVCHTVQRIKCQNADGDFRTELVIGTPKSDSSFREIPLMPDIEALCSHFAPALQEAFVLTGTKKCMDPRKLQRRLQRYLTECGISEAHFHTLRHTFATRCVEVGFDVKTLSEILGHSNTNITLNKYVHPNMMLKRENMNKLKSVICL